MPALGQNHRAASSPRTATSQRGAFVSEPSWRALHALRHSHTGRAVRHEAACHRAGSPGKADQSPRHSPFDRHALAAGGRRHQHNSGLARACVARHHRHLRRDRSCDKETSAGDAGSRENTKDGWRMVPAAGCNGFPSRPVASRVCGAGLVVAIKDWPRSGSAPHIGERHILVGAVGQRGLVQDAEPRESFGDLGSRHGSAVSLSAERGRPRFWNACDRPWAWSRHSRPDTTADDRRAASDHPARRTGSGSALAARGEHLPGAAVTIPVP